MKCIVAVAVVICLFSLPACRPGNVGDVDLTVWAAMSAEELGALRDIAESFERETGKSVRIVQIGLFEITTKLELAAPAHKGPDVVTISHTSVGTLTLMGLLAPVEQPLGARGPLSQAPGRRISISGRSHGPPADG